MRRETEQIRSFNRFYTNHLGLLNEHILNGPYSLAEARILYEIGLRQPVTAQKLAALLDLDKGYLSKIIKMFVNDGVIERTSSEKDSRVYQISLTSQGSNVLSELQGKSGEQIEGFLNRLSKDEADMLVSSMRTVESLLSTDYNNQVLSRQVVYQEGLRPGDIGYLIYLHGVLYARESGYSQEFEGYVVKTFYEFLEHYDIGKDKIWLASYNQQIIGCIAILSKPNNEAQLRWFLVHPVFRGTGVGKHLLTTALEHCREQQFRNVYLLTTDVQQKAIAMYKKAGFQPTASIEMEQWGKTLHEERYDLSLIN
ncbi:MarR family transcriptional regulator [Mucilaginibacter sp. Bleaf8]|uniref:bifunctional helix-turn-helix transcriptional regulator/GNAT family N-acetyltransferase n=1 Tax=Mucilaginibacter sp. Bleaf8 TaxID=2834430 RepID=UPI001BCA7A2D|nr:helix-turn-helix domain-containing GNAT family N-acetyltransferase [Mucilaginibacter sp. Bleaf8]MBS7565380.1 MarR family transcriptional regulator [Mucilaginibacter sp. Bleaf8]